MFSEDIKDMYCTDDDAKANFLPVIDELIGSVDW